MTDSKVKVAFGFPVAKDKVQQAVDNYVKDASSFELLNSHTREKLDAIVKNGSLNIDVLQQVLGVKLVSLGSENSDDLVVASSLMSEYFHDEAEASVVSFPPPEGSEISPLWDLCDFLGWNVTPQFRFYVCCVQ